MIAWPDPKPQDKEKPDLDGGTDFKSVPLIDGTQGSEKMRKEDLK